METYKERLINRITQCKESLEIIRFSHLQKQAVEIELKIHEQALFDEEQAEKKELELKQEYNGFCDEI